MKAAILYSADSAPVYGDFGEPAAAEGSQIVEFVAGGSLQQKLQSMPLPPRAAAQLTALLAQAVQAAHDKGILHRDLKPENLFYTSDQVLKVLDFGIARIFEGQDKTGTRQGFIMGTPAFMAPEQALAKWDEVDARTDIWAAGAMMLTLLSGRHVHEGQTGNEQLIRSATTPNAARQPIASVKMPGMKRPLKPPTLAPTM